MKKRKTVKSKKVLPKKNKSRSYCSRRVKRMKKRKK